MKQLKKPSEKTRYWLSYDLGTHGNYEEMYRLLDEYGARECGDSVATFTTSDSQTILEKKMKNIVSSRTRVYLISTSSNSGKFIHGKRKPAPWAGYAMAEEVESDQ